MYSEGVVRQYPINSSLYIMLNLLPLTQHGRNLIVAPNALLNTQITEALRARHIPVFSSALTAPILALSMFMLCKAQTAALVTTFPRMIGGSWHGSGFDRLIFIGDGKMPRVRVDRVIHRYHQHAPDAACYAFNQEGELYSPAENLKAAYHVDMETVEETLEGDILKMVTGKASSVIDIKTADGRMRRAAAAVMEKKPGSFV